ncbi:MAG: IS4 family transposase [Bryobacteraceae bacterium]
MTSPEVLEVFTVYQRLAPFTESLQRQSRRRWRRGIYSVPVVLWLMMLQRLQPKGTLSQTVQWLRENGAESWLAPCKRVREQRISASTGGYCQARTKLPTLVVQQVSEQMQERLRTQVSEAWPGLGKPVFVVDGSSLELVHTRELVKTFPPAENQHGGAHWPVLRIVVMHDLSSGMAEQPCWGAMYGKEAVSEQALAEQAIERLPEGAVVLGDRNFGVFWMAYVANQRRHPVLLRLTEVRARKLYGGPISLEGDHPVTWTTSRWDGGKQRSWPAEANVKGRLIAWRVGRGKSKQWLYLFTDLDLPPEQVVALYGQRWHIETDLRSLKSTVRLQQISAKTLPMFEKELRMAISAYNLVRTVMCLAARRAGLQPRQLSFSFVQDVVNAAWPRLVAATSRQQHDAELERVLAFAASYKLPKRRRSQTYPRAVWRHRSPFPARKPNSPVITYVSDN